VTVDDYIDRYLARNLRLTPLHPSSKRPIFQGWPQRDTDRTDFTPDRNIGLVLGQASGGVVDIDLDHPAAIVAAERLLPPTDVVFGRPAKRASHRLYRVAEPGPTVRLRSQGNRHTIVEYRADGSYTMVPPSRHPEGELVEFEYFGQFGTSTRAELVCGCRLVAAVVTLSAYYAVGSRHDIALAFSGALAEEGFDRPTIGASMEALCEITNDEEREDRLRAVADTVERRGKGQPVVGWRRLRDLVGRDIANHLTRLLKPRAGEEAASTIADPPISDHDLNDAGNADRLIRFSEGNLVYVPELTTFIRFDGRRWKRDESGLEVRRMAEEAIKQELCYLAGSDWSGRSLRFLETRRRYFERSLNLGPVRAMVEMARTRVPLALERLDADDKILGVENGVLDLQTLELRENARQQYITRTARVSFDPAARCPQFDAFLAETFGEDEALIRYVTGLLGYCLSGQTHRQEFYLFSGNGANGKSTLIAVLQHMMGDYARSILPGTLFEGQFGAEQGNYDVAELAGVRLAIAQEAESKYRLHGPRLKQLTGGDIVAARAIYKAPFAFRPRVKIIIVTNRRPELDTYDGALKRRVRVIPFDHQVPEDRRDPSLATKLSQELPGILNRLIEAGAAFAANQLPVPEAVRAATQGYFAEKDHVAAFLDEMTERAPDATVVKTELYEAYVGWCGTECVPSISKRDLTRVLRDKGFEDARTNSARIWRGLRIGWQLEVDAADEAIWRTFTAVANTG